MQGNKNAAGGDSGPENTWVARTARNLRKRLHLRGHRVHHHFIHGASYSLGSGAVSLIILWLQNRF
ncbi:hypothetical protein ABT034_34895 [Streptomyces sp. NPDC002773]|uniref:hypothetical protein n=1 Tax=Streptomyces sp. NPDC002773 TaxID=3154430 RepID=UPI00331BC5C4